MYLVVKHRKGYRAIPIHAGDDWGIQIILDKDKDHRIILVLQDLVDLPLIADTAEKRCRLKNKCGHPLDPKAQQLVDYVRVEHPDIIQIDHEPPTDVAQEDLPY